MNEPSCNEHNRRAIGCLGIAGIGCLAAFIAALLIMGGTGFIFSPSQTAGLRTLPAEMNPFGVAISTTFVQIAACIGPSLYTGIMSTAQAGALAAGAGEALATAQGFSIAMVVAACIAAAGCAANLRRAFTGAPL